MPIADTNETILIVDDQEPVRRTFREWLESAHLNCRLLTAENAASALALADKHQIDLAILDWHLGAGHDGLQLLEDLTVFHADVVAIMVTGFAHQATPLMAMRMGVRDYLDKNQDLNRDTFLKAVIKQLDRIRPARRERQLHQRLAAFRSAVERVLPLVQTTSALHYPVPLPVAIQNLFTFLLETTGAREGVLLVHSYDPSRTPAGETRAYDSHGQSIQGNLASFARSLAGSVVSMQEPRIIAEAGHLANEGTIDLHPFERDRQNILAAPITVSPGIQVVFELFDKATGFTVADRHLARSAASFAGELLRQALSERQTQRVLFDAVEAALHAGDEITRSLPQTPVSAHVGVMEKLEEGLRGSTTDALDAKAMLRLAEAIRVVALRYGSCALEHCTRLVEDLGKVLDEVTGSKDEVRG